MINNQDMRASSPVFVPTGNRSPTGSVVSEYVPRFIPESGQNTKTASGQHIILFDRAVNAKQNERLFGQSIEAKNVVQEPALLRDDVIAEFLGGRWVGDAADLKAFVSGYVGMIGELSQLHRELCSVLYCAHVYESVLDPQHLHDGHYLKKLTMYLNDMRKSHENHDLMFLTHMIKKVQQPWERLFITLQYQMNAAMAQNSNRLNQTRLHCEQ